MPPNRNRDSFTDISIEDVIAAANQIYQKDLMKWCYVDTPADQQANWLEPVFDRWQRIVEEWLFSQIPKKG